MNKASFETTRQTRITCATKHRAQALERFVRSRDARHVFNATPFIQPDRTVVVHSEDLYAKRDAALAEALSQLSLLQGQPRR